MNAPPTDHKSGDPAYHFKADAGKPDWTLIPTRAMRVVLAAFVYGAKKYEARSWRQVPNARERYTKSLLRHADEVKLSVEERGFDALLCEDEESRLPHLALAGACALILIDLALQAKHE